MVIYIGLRIRLLQSLNILQLCHIYTPSCHSIPVWLSLFCETQKNILWKVYKQWRQTLYILILKSDIKTCMMKRYNFKPLLALKTDWAIYPYNTSNMATQSSNIMTFGHMTCENRLGLMLVDIWGLRKVPTRLKPGFSLKKLKLHKNEA